MKMKTWKWVASLLIAIAVTSITTAPAVPQTAVPMLINYTGEVRWKSSGKPLGTGDYNMRFKIWFDESLGIAPEWEEVHRIGDPRTPKGVHVKDGIMTVLLGSGIPEGPGRPLTHEVFDDPDRWLEIKIGQEILEPRIRFTSVPYAMVSENSRLFGGKLPQEFVCTIGPQLMEASTLSPVLKALNTGNGTGALGTAEGRTGTGVVGKAIYDGSDNINYGGRFEAWGGKGRGVYGHGDNNEPEAANYGGYFEADGGAGTGVYGYASHTGDEERPAKNYGGYFEAAGRLGTGVYGYASHKGDEEHRAFNYGGYFLSDGNSGRGVFGRASAQGHWLANYGGDFEAWGGEGIAVRGYAVDDWYAAANYGGEFYAAGGHGIGVKGVASAGEHGYENRGGLFESKGLCGIGVEGKASDTSYFANFGGAFSAQAEMGKGVSAKATGYQGKGVVGLATDDSDLARNFGGHFEASGGLGRGIYARGRMLAGSFRGNIFAHVVYGYSKQFVQPHPTDASKQIVYVCLEGGENAVYVRGSGQLQGGRTQLQLPDHFALVACEQGLTAQVTPRDVSAMGYLYVEEVTPSQIVVAESWGGTSNARFDYMVMGVRRGFEEHEVIQENRFLKPDRQISQEGYENLMALPENRGLQQLLIQNETLTPEGKINQHTAAMLGWELGPETEAEWLEELFPTITPESIAGEWKGTYEEDGETGQITITFNQTDSTIEGALYKHYNGTIGYNFSGTYENGIATISGPGAELTGVIHFTDDTATGHYNYLTAPTVSFTLSRQ